MSDRVLSTATARDAVTQMRNILHGGLTDQITQLKQQGETLSQPDIWDGRLASEFRGQWSEQVSTINNMQTTLQELQSQVERINQDIMAAGGNS